MREERNGMVLVFVTLQLYQQRYRSQNKTKINKRVWKEFTFEKCIY